MKGNTADMTEKHLPFSKLKMTILIVLIFTMLSVSLCACSLPFGTTDKKYTATDYAMGTVINQTVYYDNVKNFGDKKNTVCLDILYEIERLEKNVLSVRYPDSAISRMNNGEDGSVSADTEDSTSSEDMEEFLSYLDQSFDLAANSSGAFSPSIGKLIRLWDIDGENPHKPEDSEIKQVLDEITDAKNGETHCTYDLGAVGKGIACDNAEKILTSTNHASHVKGAIIAVGGSILVHGEKKDGTPWEIAIANPRKADERHSAGLNKNEGIEYTTGDYLGTLSITDAGDEPVYISTSGDYEKYFEQDGIRYHHILDPSTGYPANSGLISVTIICHGTEHGGLYSDGLSTACFVLGIEKSLPLLEKYNAEAVFVDRNKHITITEKIAEKFTLLDDTYTVN